MNLQDFLHEVDVHFLDSLPQDTSAECDDLASDPPPSTLQIRPQLAVTTYMG